MIVLPEVMAADAALALVVLLLWKVAPSSRTRRLAWRALVWVGVCETFFHWYMEQAVGKVWGLL